MKSSIGFNGNKGLKITETGLVSQRKVRIFPEGDCPCLVPERVAWLAEEVRLLLPVTVFTNEYYPDESGGREGSVLG